jgi:hypothetical protein
MRLFKIEITNVPAWFGVGKPDGWEKYVAEMIEEGRNWQPDERFFWPSTDKFYRSRSSAAEKVAIVERWGGSARILEAEVSDFIPVAEANALRKRRRDNARIEKLRAKIREIEATS